MDNVHTIVVNSETWYNTHDIGNVIGLTNIRKNLAKFPKEELKLIPFKSNGGTQRTKFINKSGLKRLVCVSRKQSVQSICNELGMDVKDTHYIKVETGCIQFLMNVFDGITTCIPQYRCGEYIIDIYFTEMNVAIECDESGHKSMYEEDKKRQTWIEDTLECKFIRFYPEAKDFDISSVVNMCIKEFIRS